MVFAWSVSTPRLLACAERLASISIPYRLAGDPCSSTVNATPSPTHGSTAENSGANVRQFLRRAASGVGSGKKPSFFLPGGRKEGLFSGGVLEPIPLSESVGFGRDQPQKDCNWSEALRRF